MTVREYGYIIFISIDFFKDFAPEWWVELGRRQHIHHLHLMMTYGQSWLNLEYFPWKSIVISKWCKKCVTKRQKYGYLWHSSENHYSTSLINLGIQHILHQALRLLHHSYLSFFACEVQSIWNMIYVRRYSNMIINNSSFV